MSQGQNIENLKKIVAKNIEAGGFLNSLRAQLKVEVYKIIQAQDQAIKDQAGFQWEHPLLAQIKGIQEGMKSLELIVEYLEFFKLDYTAQVLRKEANLNDPVIRDSLAHQIGLNSQTDSLRPLLMIMIQEFAKGKSSSPIVGIQKADAKSTSQAAAKEREKQEQELKKKKEEDEIKKQQDEKKKLEEKKKKDEEDQKKQTKKETKDRPQTAPVKTEQAPIVNKIRGGPTKQNNLTSMFGINVGGPSGYEDDDIFSTKPKQKQQITQQKNNDPYAFDFGEQSKPTQMKQKPQPSADPYSYDLEDVPKQQNKKYDYNQTIGKFNNPYSNENKGNQKNKFNKNEDIEEDINFEESKQDNAKQSNLLFTSDDDYQKATQSLGVDESVDSLALEEYDYYEDVLHKK